MMRVPVLRFASILLSASLGILLTSCVSSTSDSVWEDPYLQRDLGHGSRQDSPADREETYSYWNDTGGAAPLRATIALSAQTAYFYRGQKLVGRSRVATGRSGHATGTGSFALLEKSREKRSNLYGKIVDSDGDVVITDADARTDSVPSGGRFVGASMPYWMRLTSTGIGMHAGPIPNPGRPASHGCIRMPRRMAEHLFHTLPVGTPVEIVP